MECKITTLTENCVYGRKLQAEHGLCLYVELPDAVVLFDTGASDLFVRNARLLRADLQRVDYLVLSHGHSDHSGGLKAFLEVNTRARVVCKREAFDRKFKGERENGMKGTEGLDLSRFLFVEQTMELVPGLWVFPDLPVEDERDTHFERFLVQRNGALQPDCFDDELAVVLQGEEGMAVLSACSHRGITNALRRVRRQFPVLPLKLLLGGFHIHNAVSEKDQVIAAYLSEELPERLGVCHCSGVDKYAVFRALWGDRVFYNHTGCVTEVTL